MKYLKSLKNFALLFYYAKKSLLKLNLHLSDKASTIL